MFHQAREKFFKFFDDYFKIMFKDKYEAKYAKRTQNIIS